MGLFDKLKVKRSKRDNGVSPTQGAFEQVGLPNGEVDARMLNAQSCIREMSDAMKVLQDKDADRSVKPSSYAIHQMVRGFYDCLVPIVSEDDIIALFDSFVSVLPPYGTYLRNHEPIHDAGWNLLRDKAANMPRMAEYVCGRMLQAHPANVFHVVGYVPYWEYDSFDFAQFVSTLPLPYERVLPETCMKFLSELYEHRPDLRQQILDLDGVALWGGNQSEGMAPKIIRVNAFDDTSVEVRIPAR